MSCDNSYFRLSLLIIHTKGGRSYLQVRTAF
nr:MAG TPA: hypothetical protein [Caudoviricetes sp.]